MTPDDPDHPADGADAEFVCQLLQVQLELRAFVGHLMPMGDAREDILQEVNLLLWKKRATFTAGTSFRNWSYTFARNVVMNHQRRFRRGAERLVFSDELIHTLADEFAEASPRLAERMPALRHCLGRVPEDERTLLLEHYSARGAVERRAAKSGRSAASLRGLLFRLRVALRRCIERELQENPG